MAREPKSPSHCAGPYVGQATPDVAISSLYPSHRTREPTGPSIAKFFPKHAKSSRVSLPHSTFDGHGPPAQLLFVEPVNLFWKRVR